MQKKATGVFLAIVIVLLCGVVCAAATTLEYWIWDFNQRPAVETIIEKFQAQHPDIQVNLMVVGWGDYWNKLPVAMSGGTGPDVFWMTMYDLVNWINRGLIEDLTAFIEADPEAKENFDMMWGPLREAYTQRGRIWGMPRDFDTIAVQYNADFVSAAGLVPPSQIDDHWTWDDYAEYAKKLTVRDSNDVVTRWGVAIYTSVQEGYSHFVRSNGGEFFDEDGTKMIIDSKESREAIQFLHDLANVHQGGLVGWPNYAAAEVAMVTSGNWNLFFYTSSLPNNQVAELPFSPNTGRRATTVHGLADVISPYSDKKEAAFEFIKFLSSYQAQMVLGSTGTVIPSHRDASMSYFEADVLPETSVNYLHALDYGIVYPSTPYVARPVWEDILNGAVVPAMTGDVPVGEALLNAQNQINSLIQDALKGSGS